MHRRYGITLYEVLLGGLDHVPSGNIPVNQRVSRFCGLRLSWVNQKIHHFTRLLKSVQGSDNDFENFGMIFLVFVQIFPFDHGLD
jgi:hypothetical protein